MRQAGRYLPEYRRLRERAGSFLDLCYTPSLAAEATLQPVRRFGMDAAILFSDILVVPHALGLELAFVEGEGPRLSPVRQGDALPVFDPEAMVDRLAPVYETVERVAASLPSEVALIGFAGAPWTVATYMVEGGASRDFAEVKRWAYGDEAGFARLIDVVVRATAAHLIAQIRRGAEAVQVFDSWAGVLPESAFRRWVIAPTRALVAMVREACGAVPIIGFPRGAGLMIEAYGDETGVDAVSLDATAPPEWAAATVQKRRAVQGNLDPVMLLVGGAAMDRAIDSLVETLGGGAYVFNLGHGVLPQTPPENVARLVARVRRAAG